ncbi:MAG: MBL fold metallo-hydrolase [Clostridia bacterium]|nr:MBL fold metallo-hydrolase [Clostridia bacterium]
MFRNIGAGKRDLSFRQDRPWEGKMTPFKLFSNVYYVGTYQACCYLIDTGDGLIMIDPGYKNTAYLVVNSVRDLGFNFKDIKYIICTHWHYDHSEATAAFKDLSGATTMIGENDFERAKEYFTADKVIKDGDALTLGNTTIKFMETPGHTKGTISFFFDVKEDGKTYRAGSFGGAGANKLGKNTQEFEGARVAYRNSIARLRKEKVDLFIGNHSWNNGTYEKSIKLLETGENTFLDSTLWQKFLDFCEGRLDNLEKAEAQQG